MLQRQGPPGFDPYHALQLDPSAPHPLIIEAYWLLVERAQRHASIADVEVAELNAAYNLLVVPERRRAYDAEHGLPGPAPVHGREVPAATLGLMRWRGRPKQPQPGASDCYRLLRVSPDADRDIINLAYAVLGRESARPAVRAALRDAHRTLAHPYLRARYDAQIGSAPGFPADAGAAPALRSSLPELLLAAPQDEAANVAGEPPRDDAAAPPLVANAGAAAGHGKPARRGTARRDRREAEEIMAERLFDARRMVGGAGEERARPMQAARPFADDPVTP